MDKQQNYSRSSNVKTCQTSEINRKSSDTHLNKARRRDHSNSSRNEPASRNSRQAFNNNNPKKNQGRWNNDKRPRPRGGGTAGYCNNVDEGAQRGGGAGRSDYTDGGYTNGDGFGGRSSDASNNESDCGLNFTSSGLANGSNLAISRHGKKLDYELNSVYAAGSKKQNLNHLLNFHYSPRDSENSMHDINFFGRGGSGNMQRNNNSNNNGRFKQHKYNKEQFLQANFQFVINNNARPKFEGSPDNLINWELIEQINIKTTEEPQCPICLFPPVAAKITRCGHVYCWSCILHYLSLSDKNWRRCPICFEAIHGQDLKSCTILQQHHINIGEQITFRLMRRRKGSLFIEPFETSTPSLEYYPQVGKADAIQRFSKFVIAKRNDVQEIIKRERKELLESGDNDIEDEEAYAEFVFVQQALSLCHDRMKQHGFQDVIPLSSIESDESSDNKEAPEQASKESNEYLFEVKQPAVKLETVEEHHSESEHQEVANEVVNLSPLAESLTLNQHVEKIETFNEEDTFEHGDAKDSLDENLPVEPPLTPSKSEKYHYFYQSDDGQNMYLHPLNIKMIQACYGSLDKAPSVITATVIQREQLSMDDEHRRRLTCLSHLPLTCEFSFIEVDLQPPLISPNILKQFKEDILYRKKIRQRRQREENKRERKINEFNDRQMGKLIASTANINISSPQEFPSCGFEERLPIDPNDTPSLPTSSSSSNTPIKPTRPQPTSYSNIMVFGESSGSHQVEAWPAMGAPSKTKANYQELSTAWRRPDLAAPLPLKQNKSSTSVTVSSAATHNSDHLSESESHSDDLDLRPLSTNLGDVLAKAISQTKNKKKAANEMQANSGDCSGSLEGACGSNISGSSSNTSNGNNAGGNRKKNKRSKKVLPIFATGMNYKGKD